MKKTYVIDTNVILSDPAALNAFDDNDLIVPLAVLEELDRHKSRQDEVGSCARLVNRELDKLREVGNLFTGVSTPGGGTLRVERVDSQALSLLPVEFARDKVDHIIIAHMLHLKRNNVSAILVSKDINVRVKCDALDIVCQDYLRMRVVSSPDKMYTGVKVIEQPDIVLSELYSNNVIDLPESDSTYYPNQIVVVKSETSQNQTALTRVVPSVNNKFVLRRIIDKNAWGLHPRNKEQRFALDLLFDDDVKLVTLTGPAGTGKTLLALAAGLSQIKTFGDDPKYGRMIVTRSAEPVGKDIGFLPGTLFEKMDPWLSPIKDNLNFLLSKGTKKNVTRQKQTNGVDGHQDPYFTLMLDKGLIEVVSITHIRGRSIPDAFVIIDEAQNLSQHELKTIVTRVGEGTKIVLLGDTAQIDNVRLDVYSNGLTNAVEKFKNSNLAGHVSMLKGERSLLASEAARIL